jgi:carbon storage regulator
MLVLTRKVGERIVVPNCSLIITIIALEGSRVLLGLAAPPDVDVYREEVWLQLPQSTPVEVGHAPHQVEDS